MPEDEMITPGPVELVDLPRLAHACVASCTSVEVELEVGPHGQAFGQIVLRGVIAIDVHAADGHRAVEKDGNLAESASGPSGLAAGRSTAAPGRRRTRPPASRRRGAIASCTTSHNWSSTLTRRMIAIAVGALADQVVARRRRLGIVIQRRVVAAHVARKHDPQRLVAAREFRPRSCTSRADGPCRDSGPRSARPAKTTRRDAPCETATWPAARRARRTAATPACASKSPCGWRTRRLPPGCAPSPAAAARPATRWRAWNRPAPRNPSFTKRGR